MEIEYLSTGAIDRPHAGAVLAGLGRALRDHGASFVWRRRLSTYGRIFKSPIGMIGFALVLFWLLTALMADWVALFDPYEQIRAMQNEPPGAIVPGARRCRISSAATCSGATSSRAWSTARRR